MQTTKALAVWLLGALLIAPAGMYITHSAMAATDPNNAGPTKENALAAEKEISAAMRTNDGDGLCRVLDPDWAIVDGLGGVGDDPGERDSICTAIKTGVFTRKTYDVDFDHARVRVYGDVATITFQVSYSGSLKSHKPFSVKGITTDVLKWENGGWKGVLTHETNVAGTLVQ